MRKRDLASPRNLTSDTLSRALPRLVECGPMESHDQRLRILDLSKLQDVADGLLPAGFA